MLKLCLSCNLMIMGAVTLLFLASSASADDVSSSIPSENYTRQDQQPDPSAPSAMGSLGTLRRSDLSSTESNSSFSNRQAPEYAPSDQPLQPVITNNITYITGGIGDEERSMLENVEKDYNLRIMSASKNGDFAGDTRIIIRDHTGNELVNAMAGPLFYAQLPMGTYTVEAATDGQSKKERVSVGQRKATSVRFSWQ